MDGYEINEVVVDHLHIGSESLFSYKKIIQKSAYPPFGRLLSLETAQDAIDAYTKSGGSLFNTLELSIFFLECGTHFASDFGGDMGEDFYEILENTFEDTLKKIKNGESHLFEHYAPRLRAIIEVSQDTGWGYEDELTGYWQEYFGMGWEKA
jgi:hypothetical protein